jgi:formate dehydrogenase
MNSFNKFAGFPLRYQCTTPNYLVQRCFGTAGKRKEKILCALYEGGEAGRKNKNIFGCVENGLDLQDFLKKSGHEFVVTSDKDGHNSVFEKNLHDATVVISQPFWPAYLTKERIAKAPHLKMAITAGVGSDHVDLEAASKAGITVIEVTGCNVVSVAEHVVMQILALVRNYIPAYHQVKNGEWNIAAIADKAWDLEGKHVGTVAAGRIGYRVLQRLKPFDVHLHYTDKFRLPAEKEKELNVTWHPTVESLVKVCDVVTINCPLHPETERLFNHKLLSSMKKGSYIVNTARGKIVDTDALVQAVESGHIEGYAGDVWFPQPASRYHPWRQMPRHAMTPHYSGNTLSAQARVVTGVKEILSNYFSGKPQNPEYLIVDEGKVVSPSYTQGNATSGSL